MKTTKRIIAMFMAALMFVTGFAMNASALKATPSNPDPKDNSVIITISELEEGYAVSKDDTVIKKGTATVAAADYKLYLEENKLTVANLAAGTYTVTVKAKKESAEDITAECNITIKTTPAAPAAPASLETTKNSIKVASVKDAEYAIVEGSAEPDKWQTSNEFTGLKEDTWYKVFVRLKETETANASAYSSIEIKTLKAADTTAPAKPVIDDVTETSITVKATEGYQYSKDGGKTFVDNNVFTGLTKGATYFIQQRRKAESGQETNPASPSTTVTTNTAAKFVASAANVKPVQFADASKIYTGQDNSITVYGLTRTSGDAQWGDIEYIPVSFEVKNNGSKEGETHTLTLKDAEKASYTGSFNPKEANSKYSITVTYNKVRKEGANGETSVGTYTKTTEFTTVKKPEKWQEIMTSILNFFATNIPKIMNGLMKVIKWLSENHNKT